MRTENLSNKIVWNTIFWFHKFLKTFLWIFRNGNLGNKIDWNYSKYLLNTIFCFHKVFKKIPWIYKDNQDYKNQNIERKYLQNMQYNQFLRVKNSLFWLEKDFTELKYIELKDRIEKIKKEIDKLINKLVIVPKDDMVRFEEHEMRKKRPIIWDFLILKKKKKTEKKAK